MVLIRQRQHRLRKEGQSGDVDGQLARPRPHQEALHSDVVAQVEQLVQRERVFANIVLAHVDLDALAALLQLCEASLALHPDCHHAPRDARLDVLGGKLFDGLVVAIHLLAQRQ